MPITPMLNPITPMLIVMLDPAEPQKIDLHATRFAGGHDRSHSLPPPENAAPGPLWQPATDHRDAQQDHLDAQSSRRARKKGSGALRLFP